MKQRYSFILLLGIFLFAQGCASSAPPQSFSTPDEGVNAIVAAGRAHSSDQLIQILGRDAGQIVSSGDPVADRNALDGFLQRYDQKHQLTTESDGSVTLVVGDNEWPMPIPLVKDDATGKWHFDAARGRDEIINRRIGRNELDVIQVCLAIADAQSEYAVRDPENVGVPVYAQKFLSDPGRKNGLYWSTSDDQQPSPLGALAATASEQGYHRSETGRPQPFHGYYYRMLMAQGSHASGGARSYIINGKMVGGFGVVAYPAEYGNSGIMTFIVNYEGVVYQQDLGKDTAAIAKSMAEFDPGPDWNKVEQSALSQQP
ncbi:MAG TPA: DUF2950 domain-containing protein [Tepidisphaeraceae bacterium]|nr:DUF2950 domain-containing protein [Tepidisphaeraceae bacterium]